MGLYKPGAVFIRSERGILFLNLTSDVEKHCKCDGFVSSTIFCVSDFGSKYCPGPGRDAI